MLFCSFVLLWIDNLFHNGFASGELKEFYSLAPVAFVGGSLVKGLSGHNLAEAAAAGCVVLTGTLQPGCAL